MLRIAIHCIQHSQAMLERGVCELAHSFFHFFILYEGIGVLTVNDLKLSYIFQSALYLVYILGIEYI